MIMVLIRAESTHKWRLWRNHSQISRLKHITTLERKKNPNNKGSI